MLFELCSSGLARSYYFNRDDDVASDLTRSSESGRCFGKRLVLTVASYHIWLLSRTLFLDCSFAMGRCRCCGEIGRTKVGCSCAGGKSHTCRRLIAQPRRCSCCGEFGRTIRGCSCKGGVGSHTCRHLLEDGRPDSPFDQTSAEQDGVNSAEEKSDTDGSSDGSSIIDVNIDAKDASEPVVQQ